ncbi:MULTISPECIES: glycoside hydrolase family 5 protein [Halorussus]|uniref:glycoside hydrolase family 5 protein n=1 Tax=Halorussus TaxID=1070314 RepID=UPI00209CED6C|nr:glycoside hydrolase family 5 protein [Halorussus vallis]USZ76137.1 glycoside hydrolase family 5 protein [Halorussus vallis]
MTDDSGAVPGDLQNVRGAVYFPRKDWNAYQLWANYEDAVVERDLGYAASLGLNSLRVWTSYEYWRENGPAFFSRVEHFLATCERRGIRPLMVLFEAPPKDPPTEENLRATDPANGFGVHSPSRPEIIRKRNWKGYARSPIHFARRWAEKYGEDDRVLATEIMNEPGKVRPRRDFVFDALAEVREAAPDATLTMGTKDVYFSRLYDRDGDLDVYQFHMNLPLNPRVAEEYVADQHERAAEGDGDGAKKPIWCTEWQRTLEEPPVRFAPNLASLAPTIQEAHEAGTIDGNFFWALMLKPAYLREPRKKGRINGLFHPDGSVYSTADARALAAGTPAVDALDVAEYRALPADWNAHPFPYPSLSGVSGAADGASGAGALSASDAPDANAKGTADRTSRDAAKSDRTASAVRSDDALAAVPPEVEQSLVDRIRAALKFDLERDP